MGASGMAIGAILLLPGLIAVGSIGALLVGAGSGALAGGFLGGLVGSGISRDLEPPKAPRARTLPGELAMLESIAILLVVLWLLGLVTSYTIGGFIHVLLVIAVIVILVRIIRGRKAV